MLLKEVSNQLPESRRIRRMAMLVVHSDPLAEPGAGDAGGMTVYTRQIARSLAARDIQVDLYTRRHDRDAPQETELLPGVRVLQVDAGSPGLAKEEIPAYLPQFTANLIGMVEAEYGPLEPYDILHSHYWLSGRVAGLLKARWATPFVHTFHTLGLVKNGSLRPEDLEEPEARLNGEARVIADACAIVASSEEERRALVDLYAAHPERIHVVAPGVDHSLFYPGSRDKARQRLGLGGKKVLLFVGRLQPLKAADTAIRALAHLVDSKDIAAGSFQMLVVGGASGMSGAGELERLKALAATSGLSEVVQFVPVQPQERLRDYYQAADVCLVPSRSESFGLVALEAQACGTPVVGSSVGGLRSIVKDGRTGFLVDPEDIEAFASKAGRILNDPILGARMGKQAELASQVFCWDKSAAQLHEIYAASGVKPECLSKDLVAAT